MRVRDNVENVRSAAVSDVLSDEGNAEDIGVSRVEENKGKLGRSSLDGQSQESGLVVHSRLDKRPLNSEEVRPENVAHRIIGEWTPGEFKHDAQDLKQITRVEPVPSARLELMKPTVTEENDVKRRVTRSGRVVKLSRKALENLSCFNFTFNFTVIKNNEMDPPPTTYKKALASSESEEWKTACEAEMKALIDNETFEWLEIPRFRKVISTKWVFARKTDDKGNVIKHKARIVARGFEEIFEVDYNITFAPTVRFESIRLLIAYAAYLKAPIRQLDINSAFLNGILTEEIYVFPPDGYKEHNRVWKLNKTLYGLKQSPYEWNARINAFLVNNLGFKHCFMDYGVYSWLSDDGGFVFLALFVDGILLFGSSVFVIDCLKDEFKLKDMGLLSYFLGMSVLQDFENGVTCIGQEGFVDTLMKKFELQGTVTAITPLDPKYKPDQRQEGEELNLPVDERSFQSIIGSLQYLAQCTRPDFLFSVNFLSRFNSSPKVHHLDAAIRVLRYVKGTAEYKVRYSHQPYQFALYVDASFNNKSGLTYTGYIGVFAGGPIYWNSKKNLTSTSTSAAEYLGVCNGVKQLNWHTNMTAIHSMAVGSQPYDLLCDNKGTVDFLRTNGSCDVIKDFTKELLYAKDLCDLGAYIPTQVSTQTNFADIMTKATAAPSLRGFVKRLQMN